MRAITLFTTEVDTEQSVRGSGGTVAVRERAREGEMCLTCGCMLPHEDHGNPDYLLIEHLEKSAKIDGIDLDEAVQRLIKTVEVAKQETEHDHR